MSLAEIYALGSVITLFFIIFTYFIAKKGI